VVVLTRLRTDPATRAYATRRRAQGKTNREIRRCLVRYVARQLYRLLEPARALTQHRSVREHSSAWPAPTATAQLTHPRRWCSGAGAIAAAGWSPTLGQLAGRHHGGVIGAGLSDLSRGFSVIERSWPGPAIAVVTVGSGLIRALLAKMWSISSPRPRNLRVNRRVPVRGAPGSTSAARRPGRAGQTQLSPAPTLAAPAAAAWWQHRDRR
jgi:hypothetical protein